MRCGHRSGRGILNVGSAIGIDATFPFGAEIKSACAASRVCGPALAEHGHEFFEVAAIPGWQDYDFPELRNRGAAPVSARSP